MKGAHYSILIPSIVAFGGVAFGGRGKTRKIGLDGHEWRGFGGGGDPKNLPILQYHKNHCTVKLLFSSWLIINATIMCIMSVDTPAVLWRLIIGNVAKRETRCRR